MTVCTAKTRSGRPCRANAVPGTHPPRCFAHGGRRSSNEPAPDSSEDSFDAAFTIEEVADLVARATDESLDDEIAAARLATEQVMKQLKKNVQSSEYARLARLVFTGANTIARLLTTQRALSGESEDGIARAIAQALDELSQELGVEL